MYVVLALFPPDITEMVQLGVKAVVALIGAFVAWLVIGPVVGIIGRVIRGKAAPGWLVSLTRLGGAVAVALAIFFFLPISFGPGGFGWGGGGGGGFGLGTGSGKGSGEQTSTEKNASKNTKNQGSKGGREVAKIVLIESARMQNLSTQDFKDRKFYLLEDQEPPKTLKEIKAFFQSKLDNKVTLEVNIVLKKGCPAQSDPAVRDLRELADKEFRYPTLIDDQTKSS